MKKMTPYTKDGETKLINEDNEAVLLAVLEAGWEKADKPKKADK